MELTENEKKKLYLKSYRVAIRREQVLLDEIQRLRADKMFPSIVQDGMPHGSGCNDLSAYAAALDEAINDLKEQRLKKVQLCADIQQKIKRIHATEAVLGYIETDWSRRQQDNEGDIFPHHEKAKRKGQSKSCRC